ncbi:dehydrogenase/reductase SDR family member on chromosome X isoform X1 [Capsicum annuum]|uniref:dehydrogenase/reductase SDR family member on chromosome X isoform X1 n=1 Tax=Capsicum annuum TaxID=4072 RepID=UPI001FB19D17|nr:dehydrogenase/reductase SDR family member on chromosome X isoform X1 [Capsicum annuum]
MGIKELKGALMFVCNGEFWRMGVIWTISLIRSYFNLFLQTHFARKSKLYDRSPPSVSSASASIRKPLCIITGATSGLGAAVSYALAKEGYYIVLAGRSLDSLSKIVSEIQEQIDDAFVKAFQVDLSSYKSILSFKLSLQQWLLDSDLHCSIQLLINNAGILATSYRITAEQCDKMMSTNYIGPFCLTKLLLPLLEQSHIPSRVVNVTSFTHRSVSSMEVTGETISGQCFSKLSSYPFAHVYEYSKSISLAVCLLLFTYELHRQVGLVEKSHSVSVIAADPGVVKTNIMREIPSCLSCLAYYVLKLLGLLQSPEVGIDSILDAVHAPPETSGVYFFGGNGRTLRSSRLSYNSKLTKDLWDASSQIFLERQLASQDTT